MGQYEFPNPEWSEVSQEGENPLWINLTHKHKPTFKHSPARTCLDVFSSNAFSRKLFVHRNILTIFPFDFCV